MTGSCRSRAPIALAVAIFLVSGPLRSAEVEAAITIDPDLPAGTDGKGRVLLYAPNPLEPGSSISHFDRSAKPNLLMEPNIASDLPPLGVDLTRQQLQDIGWSTSGGARIEINFDDSPGQGFNDPQLGSQRRAALRRAADVWQSILSSPVTIHLGAAFSSLTCSNDDGATLAQAGTNFVFKVDGTPFANTWYHAALAEALTGQNLSLQQNSSPTASDMRLTFNDQIDQNCLAGTSFDYSLDGKADEGKISFISVALHEMAHGLGFANFVNESTGSFLQGAPGVYSQFTRDNVLRKTWAQMTAAQRKASAVRTGEIVWSGNRVNRQAARLLDPSPVLAVARPASAAGSYVVSLATFGPQVDTEVAHALLIGATSGGPQGDRLCGPVQNRAAIAGNIALVHRGDCLFIEKAQSAEAAGAIGVVVINNEPGLITMGCPEDCDTGIPIVMVSQADGAALEKALRAPEPPIDVNPEPEPEPEFEDPSTCVATDTAHCLNGGRFRVEATFDAGTLGSGAAQRLDLTADTGLFWFFDPANVELVVKVLDGCAVNGRKWVFVGGLTDVEVELVVVDTTTGRVLRYRNAANQPFEPIQDTGAFDSCP